MVFLLVWFLFSCFLVIDNTRWVSEWVCVGTLVYAMRLWVTDGKVRWEGERFSHVRQIKPDTAVQCYITWQIRQAFLWSKEILISCLTVLTHMLPFIFPPIHAHTDGDKGFSCMLTHAHVQILACTFYIFSALGLLYLCGVFCKPGTEVNIIGTICHEFIQISP